MADVFLSYSREDKEMMQQVRQMLRSAGLSVWTDEEDLAPGTPSWTIAIENALETADCMVVLFSPSAKRSKWVNEELNYAKHQERPIFPILADGNEKNAVPFGFSTANWIDIRFEFAQEMERLIAVIKNVVGIPEAARSKHQTPYREFWTTLLERSRGKTSLFSNIAPGGENWISTGSGRSGMNFAYVITRKAATVNLYIDVGDVAENKALFDTLYQQKEAIEDDFGGSLEWQRLDNRQACRIQKNVDDRHSFTTPKEWSSLQDKMIDAMIRLDRALRQRIAKG